MNNLKERIRGMNIVRNTLKKNISYLPWYSREDAIKLITAIEEDIEYFKKKNKESNTLVKQLNLF